MGKLFWMIAAGAAGYFGYRGVQRMERGIRREAGREEDGVEIESVAVGAEASSPGPAPKATEAPTSLEERILRAVTESPGILQTELYALFPEENRRNLQEALRKMEREEGLKRAREGGTYRLFPN